MLNLSVWVVVFLNEGTDIVLETRGHGCDFCKGTAIITKCKVEKKKKDTNSSLQITTSVQANAGGRSDILGVEGARSAARSEA